MENTVCFSVLVDNTSGPNFQLGMRALPLYCRNSFSDGVWPFVVAPAPRHMPRGVLGVPMERMFPDHQVVDLGVVLYAPSSLVDCTLLQKTSLYGVKPVAVCTVVL